MARTKPYRTLGVEEEKVMAGKLEKTEVVSVEDALQMEIIVNQALIDILVDKGFITYDELMVKIKKLKKEAGVVLS